MRAFSNVNFFWIDRKQAVDDIHNPHYLACVLSNLG